MLIDSTSDRRVELCKIVRPFNIATCEMACLDEDWRDVAEFDSMAAQCDICLVHINDQEVEKSKDGERVSETDNTYLEYLGTRRKPVVIVVYSGGELRVTDRSDSSLKLVQNGRQWKLSNIDASRFCIVSFALNAENVEELQLEQGLKSLVAGGSLKAFREIVCPALTSFEVLPSLSILCQGYLVASARQNENGTWEPVEITPALRQMGWLALVTEEDAFSASEVQNVSARIETVARGGWWLQPFELLVDNQEVDAVRWEQFVSDVEDEWGSGLPDEVRALLDLICEKLPDGAHVAGTVGNAEVVARVYCLIVEKLGGERCEPM